VTEDSDFVVTATCVEHGMGTWNEVLAQPEELRKAYYYHIARGMGFNVDWGSGRVWRDKT
jgi:hypothetical protein